MLRALAILLTCQLVGEAITRSLELPLPGPVLGLLILVAILFGAERRRLVDSSTIDETSLGKMSNGLIATLGILFVPAGVGVIQELDLLGQYGGEASDRDYAARGFAAGVAAHGIGAARAFAVDPLAGTMAGIAMGLDAVLSSVLVAVFVRLFMAG